MSLMFPVNMRHVDTWVDFGFRVHFYFSEIFQQHTQIITDQCINLGPHIFVEEHSSFPMADIADVSVFNFLRKFEGCLWKLKTPTETCPQHTASRTFARCHSFGRNVL